MDRVWEVLAAFGAFGFCKAHAAAFAVPVYQSAWLKRHHPAAFYAGVLSHDPGMYPKRVIVQDARLSGVAVRPVDVNASGADWTVTPGPTPGLRVALREVKGISDAELARITNAQPYASLRDFTERARVSRPVTERLVLVGAFDSLYANQGRPRPTRRDLLARVAVLDRSPAADPLPLDLADDGFAGLSRPASCASWTRPSGWRPSWRSSASTSAGTCSASSAACSTTSAWSAPPPCTGPAPVR